MINGFVAFGGFTTTYNPPEPSPEDGVQVQKQFGTTSAPLGYYQFLPDDYSQTQSTYPTIIFLHGFGERGNGTTELTRVLSQGIPKKLNQGWNGQQGGEKFIIISPQQFTAFSGWTGNPNDPIPNDGIEFTLWVMENYRVDTSRLYLTGLSMGSAAAVAAYTASDYDNVFAAILPVSAAAPYPNGQTCGNYNIPMWVLRGSSDTTITLSEAYQQINGFTSVGGTPTPLYNELAGAHNSAFWDRAFSTDHSNLNPNIYEWMLTHSL